ncbi:hypothetical protein LTR74_008539 [Friedmanniomyces endolithicus]|nr:hypothetical protein LTR74_008539 [Friedmanniomyces endolithicus]
MAASHHHTRAAQADVVGDIAEIAGVAEVETPRVHVVELDFGPLRLPKYNILARSWSKDDKKANEVLTSPQYNKQVTEAIKNEANNLRRKRSEQITIRYARDTHLNFPELPGQHLDDELKRVADVYLCKGPVHDPSIYDVLYKKPAVNHANYNEHRLKLAKRSTNAQYHTTKYARRTGKHLVEMTGGVAAWRAATHEERIALVRHLFIEFPLTCCKGMFRFENNSFDFDTVWAISCDKTIKWQRFWRSIYIGTIITAIETVVFAASGTTAEKGAAEKALFSYWKTCKASSSFDQLDLGTAADVISRPSRAAGDTRRAVGHESVHVDIVD